MFLVSNFPHSDQYSVRARENTEPKTPNRDMFYVMKASFHATGPFAPCLSIFPRGINETIGIEWVNCVFNITKFFLTIKCTLEMRCYDENSSINYMGSLSMSRNGKMCDNWNTHTHFEKINHAYCRNFGENKPWCFVNGIKEYCSIKPCPREVTDPKCYTGNGEYYGQQSISKSGRPCITWNKVYQYSNLDHSYCRNYGKDRTEPWCYVDINTAESCGIPKCIAPGNNKIIKV